MKNRLTGIIVLAAVLITIGLFVFNQSYSNNEMDIERALYQMGKGLNDQLAGRELSDIVCMDSLGNAVFLSQLAARGKVLVYYYSELHCNSCYESHKDLLEKNVDTKKLPVLILGSYFNYRHFAVYVKMKSCSLPIYRVEHDPFQWTLDHIGFPYYFVLNADMTVSYFYIPQNNNPANDILYLERVQAFIETD
jgi:hypothetical protein